MGGKSDAVRAVGAVAQSHQYTLLQDGQHGNDSNFDFAWSKEVVDELAKSGVKHYVIEMDQKTEQPYIDKLASGEISKKEFIDYAKEYNTHGTEAESKRIATDLADMIIHAKQHGIKVHALDDTDTPFLNAYQNINILEDHGLGAAGMTVGELEAKLEKALTKDMSKEMRDFLQETLDGVGEIGASKDANLSETLSKALYNERVAGDKALADRIENVVGGDKAAILYGAGHGMSRDGARGKDLDEHLGNDKVGKILLTPNAEDWNMMQESMGEIGSAQEIPATIIYTDANPNDLFGRHEIQTWKDEARGIGDELNTKADFENAKYGQLDLPPSAMIPSRAVIVDEGYSK